MKTRLILASALLLAGCQLSNDTVEPEVPTNVPAPEAETAHKVPEIVEPIIEEEVVLTPQEQEDVWDRIVMQLTMEVPLDNERVAYYRDWYLKHPTHLKTVAQRAEPFLFYITEEVEKRGFPLEIALLPIVESSFDQFAYSHGRAAGLWQITPPTGRTFGLEQNWWYDGRRDIVESTRGALDLLDYLQKKFDGNWLHALAAYNTGEGRVFRAIRNNRADGKPTDFFALSLPRETSDYVPKLLAVADVIANADEYGLTIPEIANTPVLEQVQPGVQMDLALAASFAGMTMQELQSLNPGYNQWATAPEGPHTLLLPVDKVESFETKFAANDRRGMNVIRYQIQSGDTLSGLARKHNTRVDLIMEANDMTSSALREGRYLMIPIAGDGNSWSESRAALAQSQNTHGNGQRSEYVVQSGDTLSGIAQSQGVTVKELTRWNGLSTTSTIRVGQKLTIFGANGSQASHSSSSNGIIRTIRYEVRSGDSLSTIAQQFKVTISDLVEWNDLDVNGYLRPGQTLKVNVDVTRVSS
uniref:lytic transglycosylase n=1 Tax=Thaumasiovibrio occultus TaxID=1891184 RepID=UPI000B35DDE1|nr:LysM peptidoglycan-binding domain-containing protein [Thaumasiovibrio occultus]